MQKWMMIVAASLILLSCAGEPVVSPTVTVMPSASVTPKPITTPTPESTPVFSSYPVETVAGSGQQGFQDGPALQARFNEPWKPCLDARDGSIYIPDTHLLRKLTPDGHVLTVAGGQEPGYQDGPALQARFNLLISCAVDVQGNVLLADARNHRIRKLTPDGEVLTFLGTGQSEALDGNAEVASFEILNDLLLLPSGELYITDRFRIRRFHNQELLTLNTMQSYEATKQNFQNGPIATTHSLFGRSLWLTLDPQQNIYVSDMDLQSVRQIDVQGYVSNLSHSLDDAMTQTTRYGLDYFFYHWFEIPMGLVFDTHRNRLYVIGNGNIYEKEPGQDFNLIAHKNYPSLNKLPSFDYIKPGCLFMGMDHQLYFVDRVNHQVKRLRLPSLSDE